MEASTYSLMQKAVDIVGTSPHPTNKIAATLAGRGPDGTPYILSRTNYWPPEIANRFENGSRIGSSSGTIHAETACILNAPCTADSQLFITDLPCPNCVKNMAEAGIRALYIDHKGFDKEWAVRRGHTFAHMAMKICEKAGISVYKIHRKEQRTETILKIPDDFTPDHEKPIRLEKIKITGDTFRAQIKTAGDIYKDEPFALAFAHDMNGNDFILSGAPHATIGYTEETLDEPEGKYSFILEPINRLLMQAARHGLKIIPEYLYSSRVPTSREQVNMCGAGLFALHLGNTAACRDESGLKAMEQLSEAGIITYKSGA